MRLLRPLLLIWIVLLALPRVVKAQENLGVYFYEQSEPGVFEPIKMNIMFGDGFTTEEKAMILFTTLMENKCEYATFVPEGTKLIWVVVADERLIVNISNEALNYGGTANEAYFVEQIVNTAYSIQQIRSIMLYVDGKEASLPEGTDFTSYDR